MRGALVEYYHAQAHHLSLKYQQLAWLERQLLARDALNHQLQLQIADRTRLQDATASQSSFHDSHKNKHSSSNRTAARSQIVSTTSGPEGRDGLDYLRAHQENGKWRGRKRATTTCQSDYLLPQHPLQTSIPDDSQKKGGLAKEVYLTPRPVLQLSRLENRSLLTNLQTHPNKNHPVLTEESEYEPILTSKMASEIPHRPHFPVSQLCGPVPKKGRKMFLSVVSSSRRVKKDRL